MADIVERLRHTIQAFEDDGSLFEARLYIAAATEIESLRARLAAAEAGKDLAARLAELLAADDGSIDSTPDTIIADVITLKSRLAAAEADAAELAERLDKAVNPHSHVDAAYARRCPDCCALAAHRARLAHPDDDTEET